VQAPTKFELVINLKAAKALDLMAPILGTGRAKELIEAIYKLDSVGPVTGLRRLLQA